LGNYLLSLQSPRKTYLVRELLCFQAEDPMSLIDILKQSEAQSVEVSGWDEKENFFVETADLDWDDFAGKHLSLQHKLTSGAMIFVRTLQRGSGQAPPSVYVVEFLGNDVDGHHEFRLNAVRPKYSREDHNVN
jgi:hypothetical protein